MSTSGPRTAWRYFGLVFLLSSPAWLAGALAPDALSHILGINLPLSALMTFVPAAVALLFSYRGGGRAAAVALLQKLFDKKSEIEPVLVSDSAAVHAGRSRDLIPASARNR